MSAPCPAAPPADAAPVHALAGRVAARVLAGGGGRVLAVFRRSAYLDSGADLLCVGDRSIPAGPLNLRLAAGADRIACRAGDRWRFRDGVLALGCGDPVRLAPIRSWRPPPRVAVVPGGLERALAACREGLAAPGPGLPGSAGAATRMRLEQGMSALSGWVATVRSRAGTRPAVPETVLALLGCGPGLTPSGDDVLVGALVALRALAGPGLAELLADSLRRSSGDRTGRISAAHLAAACDGEAVAPVHALVHSLARGDADRCRRRARRLVAHGASSGRDALAGILRVAGALAQPRPSRGVRGGGNPAPLLLP